LYKLQIETEITKKTRPKK